MTPPLRLPLDVPVEPKLTPRQQAAWDYVRSVPGGAIASQVGGYIHQLGKHPWTPWCEWCEAEGLSVLRSKALFPLVIRRRTGLWEPRNPADRARQASAQTDELPDDLFGGP
jgi:hypothetical protein